MFDPNLNTIKYLLPQERGYIRDIFRIEKIPQNVFYGPGLVLIL